MVDPILSLIRDQIDVLLTYGIDRAIGITSDLSTRGAKQSAYEQVLGGDNIFHYIAPERFQIEEFRRQGRMEEVRRWVDALREVTFPLGHSFFV